MGEEEELEITRLRTQVREWQDRVRVTMERYDFQVDANRSLVEAIAESDAECQRLKALLNDIHEVLERWRWAGK
jgi:hypothetical protein